VIPLRGQEENSVHSNTRGIGSNRSMRGGNKKTKDIASFGRRTVPRVGGAREMNKWTRWHGERLTDRNSTRDSK